MRKLLLAFIVIALANAQIAEAASCASPQFAWNPSDKASGVTLSTTVYTNDTATASSSNGGRGTPIIPSGTWYFEIKDTNAEACPAWLGGVGDSSAPLTYAGSTHYAQLSAYTGFSTQAALYGSNTATICASTGTSCAGMNIVSGSWYSVAVDIPNHKIWFGPTGGGWCGSTGFSTNPLSVDPTGNINGYTTAGLSNYYLLWYGGSSNDKIQINDGSSNFVGSIPTGFSALCSAVVTPPAGAPIVEILAGL